MGTRAPGAGDGPILQARVLGELELFRGRDRLAWELSRKTRALLGYLVVTGRAHCRSDLCDLLWEGPDDPRGSLRWSLSRIRRALGKDAHRLESAQDRVGFRLEGASFDLARVRTLVGKGARSPSTADLRAAAAEFRGELLAGLELDDSFRFRAWCLAERERARALQIEVLCALVRRLDDRPHEALAYASAWAAVDPFTEGVHATLVRLLRTLGRSQEALAQYENSRRLLEREACLSLTGDLDAAREGLVAVSRAVVAQPASDAASAVKPPPLVGRARERAVLERRIASATAGTPARPLLFITGEAGLGKSRLLDLFAERMAQAGGQVLSARSFEAETGRAYGAWIDAFSSLPATRLPPRLWGERPAAERRDSIPGVDAHARLFDTVAGLLREWAQEAPIALLLDDLQWADEASLSLLHFAARTCGHVPSLVLAAAARPAELLDHPAAARVVRSLRAEGHLEELRLRPLSETEARELAALAGSPDGGERAGAIGEGNPLFTIEAARAMAAGERDPAASLDRLIEAHWARLDEEALQLLGWAAALGREFDLSLLAAAGSWAPAHLAAAVAMLERRGLWRALGSESCDFTHDFYRQAAYRQLSGPRRRLVHAQIARVLAGRIDPDGERAAELARHAELGGEPELAARACLRAAERCLRLFAVADASALADRGRHQATLLPPPTRVSIETSLLRLLVLAGAHRSDRRPDLEPGLSKAVEEARTIGLHVDVAAGHFALSVLFQDRGDFARAREHTLRAEEAGRRSDATTAARQQANTARCLTQLGRDVPRARMLAAQAAALAEQFGLNDPELDWARGLLERWDGHFDQAALYLERALLLAVAQDDRRREHGCLVSIVLVALESGRFADAQARAKELVPLAARLGAAEAAQAEALLALSRIGSGSGWGGFQEARASLRSLDSKADLASILSLAAECALEQGDGPSAEALATDALAAAEPMNLRSEAAVARSVLARVRPGQPMDAGSIDADALSAVARRSLEAAAAAAPTHAHTARRDRRG